MPPRKVKGQPRLEGDILFETIGRIRASGRAERGVDKGKRQARGHNALPNWYDTSRRQVSLCLEGLVSHLGTSIPACRRG